MMLPSNRFKALTGNSKANTASESTIYGAFVSNGALPA
jgi:hypothetical protein